MDRNLVVFKGGKNGVTVELDSESSFDELKENLNQKVMNAHNFFEGSKLTVNFNGRSLAAEEEQELLGIITNVCNAEAVRKQPFSLKKREREPRKRFSPLRPDPPLRVEQPAGDPSVTNQVQDNMQYMYEGMSVIHQGSLRSGQSIRYPGSVMIVGNVHSGAEVIAEGCITVLGSIKGMVHAGCSGDRSCFVTAIKLEPIQLRIADIITYVPQSYIKKNRGKVVPSYAYVADNEIYIAPLV